jgi:hypothetical protein
LLKEAGLYALHGLDVKTVREDFRAERGDNGFGHKKMLQNGWIRCDLVGLSWIKLDFSGLNPK